MYRLERLLGFRIVRPTAVALIFEQVHLQKFLTEYQIDCVFDVGANEGQYAMMLREIGYQGTIVSFEPVPKAAEILRQKAKGDPQWFVEQIALDSSIGTATFHVMAGSQFSSLHSPSEKEVSNFKAMNKVTEDIAVQTTTLKEMYAKYRSSLNFKRPFLKMDTQGHDLVVAKGAGELLKEFWGLQSELSIQKIYEESFDYKEVLAFYISQGLELSAFVPNNQGHFPRLIEIDCIMYNPRFIS